MRRIVRGVLWIVKALLLAVALGALILWPLSHGRGQLIWVAKVSLGPQRDHAVSLMAGWGNGRVGLGELHVEFAGNGRIESREFVARHGTGWTWDARSGQGSFITDYPTGSWGPFGWIIMNNRDATKLLSVHAACMPSWLFSLIAAAWPVISLALLLRRHVRRRQLARVGCCAQCGYDLRATPQQGGDLLTRCPECGTATNSAADDKRQKQSP